MIETITADDIFLIKNLDSKSYQRNTLSSNATDEEAKQLKVVKKKLKNLAIFFSHKYTSDYGPFDIAVASGNPIAIGGEKFKRVWAGIFKGASNKQYSAQISFVINPIDFCLDVGFYFGKASGHLLTADTKKNYEGQLRLLGKGLYNYIHNDPRLKQKYSELFDFGFRSYSKNKRVLPEDWLEMIHVEPRDSQVIVHLSPNEFGVVEIGTIDMYVFMSIFLMGAFGVEEEKKNRTIKPPTPEQRAREAERLALIGERGEVYVMAMEKEKLKSSGISTAYYPKHVALESMNYGYDILSIDEKGEEIFIEVKTTTRLKDDKYSRTFFISNNEYECYENNKGAFKVYRVYDIYGNPDIDVIDLSNTNKKVGTFLIQY